MTLQLHKDAAGDLRNAAYLGVACDLAYLDATNGPEQYRSELGLEARLISVDNTQVFIGENETSIVAAFRGSEAPDSIDGFKDWLLTNANNFLILPEGRIGTDFAAAGVGARFHRGFMSALADIWGPMFAALDGAMSKSERPLWITGHSLGGAVALLSAWRLQQQFVSVHEIYTFGAPMIGNELAAQAFEKQFPGKIFRFVDDLDVVPLLPTVSLIANTYTHCQAEQILGGVATDPDGTPDTPAGALLKTLGNRAVDGIMNLSLMDEVWGCLKDRIAHHMMTNYQAKIGEKRSTSV